MIFLAQLTVQIPAEALRTKGLSLSNEAWLLVQDDRLHKDLAVILSALIFIACFVFVIAVIQCIQVTRSR